MECPARIECVYAYAGEFYVRAVMPADQLNGGAKTVVETPARGQLPPKVIWQYLHDRLCAEGKLVVCLTGIPSRLEFVVTQQNVDEFYRMRKDVKPASI